MDVLRKIFSVKIFLITNLLRGIFLFFDGIIYNLVQPLYSASLKLANIREILQQEQTVELVAGKLYIFLSVFMLFKLAFSIISLIANPDLITDKQKGLSKIFQHAIITMVLVVVMPSVFRMGYGLQDMIINEGYLVDIFGVTGEGNVTKGNEGVVLAVNVFSIFIDTTSESNSKAEEAVKNFKSQKNYLDIGILTEDSIHTQDTKKGTYDISYMMLISTISGIVLVYSFIKMGVEIAFRSLKLFVLEIISPIAIISYVDPASASKGILAKWVSLTLKTYVSLFIRLSIMYFFTSILAGIDFSNLTKGDLGSLASLLLILAILAFMQAAPKLIEDVFGYKPGEDSKAISGIVKGALGMGVGASYTGIQSARAASSQQTGFRKFTSGLGGFVKGATKGGVTGASFGRREGVGSAYANAKKSFHQSELYKALTQAKGKGKAIREGIQYEAKTPKWFDTDDKAKEEKDFLDSVDAETAAKYAAITGFGADEMKAAFRKNEAEKVANNATFSQKYAAAKNAAGDAAFAEKFAENDLRAKELAAKRLKDSKDASDARKATLEESLNRANATRNRIASERATQEALMNDENLTEEQKSIATAKKAALDIELTNIDTDIATYTSDLSVATEKALADQTAWDKAITDVTSAQGTLRVATEKAAKTSKLFEAMQKEPEYSRDVEKDSGISRSAVL